MKTILHDNIRYRLNIHILYFQNITTKITDIRLNFKKYIYCCPQESL